MKPHIKIDIVSDVVCPWCYIGKRRLEKAVDQLKDDYTFEISYLPFQLSPDTPLEGENMKERLSAKFGGEERFYELTNQVSNVAAGEGLAFDLLNQQISPNTHRLHRIGAGNIVARDVFRSIFPAHKNESDNGKQGTNPEDFPISKPNVERSGKTQPMPIKGLIPGMAVHLARCCHPLPGDRIVGIVTTGKGVTIHTIDCETLEQFADTPERWIDVSWGDGKDTPESRVGRLIITIANQPGTLGTLSTVIGKSGGNITNLKITSRSTDFWDMYLDVSVSDTKHVNNVVAALRATPQVISVERARGR